MVQTPSGEVITIRMRSKIQHKMGIVRNIATATIYTKTDVCEETQTEVENTALNGPDLGLIKGLALVISNIFDIKNSLVSNVNIEIFNKAFNVKLTNSDVNLN